MKLVPPIQLLGEPVCDCSRLERENRLLLVLAKCEAFLREEEAFFAGPSYADKLVRAWELADPRDRWRHTGAATCQSK